MTSEPSASPNNKSSSYHKAVILPIIVVLLFIAYQLSKPKVKKPVTDSAVQTTQVKKVPVPPVSTKEVKIKAAAVKIATVSDPKPRNLDEENIHSIKTFLHDWQTAWQKSAGAKGDMKKYFSFYAPSFSGGRRLSKKQWQRSKTIRNRSKSWIEVWLSNIEITKRNDNRFMVKFNQEYSSSNFYSKAGKKLILKKIDGTWKIISEKTFPLPKNQLMSKKKAH